jgi:hypothetical protein
MGVRDRFYTAQTARAILSWRLALAPATAVALALTGLSLWGAVGLGLVAYAIAVAVAMPRRRRVAIDPFTLGEPWRQIVQRSQASGRNLRDTISGADDGPLRAALESIADVLDRGLAEAFATARRGDEIDDTVRRLDPTGLRSRLATAVERAGSTPSADDTTAIESLRRQIESADRLTATSERTAAALRTTQTHLDELVARAAEVRLGAIDTDSYRAEVADLVIRIEALRQAAEEQR